MNLQEQIPHHHSLQPLLLLEQKYLLMNLLMVIYRCVGVNSKYFVCMNLIFFAYE